MKLSKFKRNKTRIEDIFNHLSRCDTDFKPNLSSYVDLNLYSKKLYNKSERFEVWQNNHLLGLLAVYVNKKDKFLFITNLSLEKELRGQGFGLKLIDLMLNELNFKNTFKIIRLEVKTKNIQAIKFYEKIGFKLSCFSLNDIMIYEKEI